MRSVFGKVAVLALASVAASAIVFGCSGQSDKEIAQKGGDEPAQSVTLNLRPVSGVQIDQVTYNVTQGMTAITSGLLPTPGTASTFSFGVPLPVGTGYNLSLSAVSTDGAFTCVGGAGPFNVIANQSTMLTLTLVCTQITTGQIVTSVDVETDACPRLIVDYVVATPHTATLPDGTIAVLAAAHDLDMKPITYQWSVASPIGTFTPPNAQNTTFNCDAAGNEVVVTVTANNGECDTALNTVVSCASLTCGNGVLDPGEDCDPALNGPTCPADCTVQCGDTVVEFGEQCEPPNTNVCTATCQTRPPLCGDGFLTPPEACDGMLFPAGTPAGATCNATCTAINIPASCGDGIVQPGETCDNPGGDNYLINNCGDIWGPPTGGAANDCNPISSPACVSCENASECAELSNCAAVAGNAAEGPAVGRPRAALCNEVLDCVRDTNCAAGLLVDCYCGTVSAAQCDAGLGNGACRGPIERGVESTNPADVQSRLQNLTLGGGLAMARVGCDQINCPVCF